METHKGRRGVLSCRVGDGPQCAEAGHCDQRNFSIKGMRRVIATHQA